MHSENEEFKGDSNEQFPFDLLRFKRFLLSFSLSASILFITLNQKEHAFGVLCGSGFFLITFLALKVFKDVILGARENVKILILFLKYPAILAAFYLVIKSNSSLLTSFTLGYLLFFPALLVELMVSHRLKRQ